MPNNLTKKEIEFPKGKENYCPRCYFEDGLTILRKFCEHNDPNASDKEEWGAWRIVSEMLDHPDENGVYPTSRCYRRLYAFICELLAAREQAACKNVREWLKYEAKGEGGMCEVCGGGTVEIRGRYPKDSKRRICPTCIMEIRESVIDNLNTEAAQEKTI